MALRIAIFSDVHANPFALDAVIDDVAAVGGVDEYWVVGDLVALGPRPVDVLERLDEIAAVATRGNTDRYLVTGMRPPPYLDDARKDPDLVARFAEIAANFAWTQGCLDAAGAMSRLEALPLEHRTTLPDGTRVLAVHAAPGTDDGAGVHSGLSDEDLAQLLEPSRSDLVFVGHTHEHLDRTARNGRVVNLGSVSLPKPGDLRASWSLLEADAGGHAVRHRRVAYDLQAVIDSIEKTRHPAREWLSSFFRGEGEFFRG
jgi:predicted phosphodiesterase